MAITIENKVLDEAGLSQSEVLIELAITLYKRGILSLGKASNLANLDKIEFRRELGKRNEFVNYDVDEFKEDLNTLRNLKL